MAKVKSRKELTHNQFQTLRAKEYRQLMTVEIPDRKLDLIVPDLWYIIYEKNLLAPKILRYSFRDKLFAKNYAEKRLKNVTRYNVLKGSDLINFGFKRASKAMSAFNIKSDGDSVHKYHYPEGLQTQRKKTMRTMYRRNYRRFLKKIMEYESE